MAVQLYSKVEKTGDTRQTSYEMQLFIVLFRYKEAGEHAEYELPQFCSFLCLFNAFCFRVTFNQYFIYLLRLNGRSETRCAVYHTDWTPHSRSRIFSSTLGAVLSAPQITAWSCIAVYFLLFFIFVLFLGFWFWFWFSVFHWELFFQHHIAPRLFNGCLPLCTEDQFRLHFQLLPVGLYPTSPHPAHSQNNICIYFCGNHFSLNDQKQW